MVGLFRHDIEQWFVWVAKIFVVRRSRNYCLDFQKRNDPRKLRGKVEEEEEEKEGLEYF